MRPGHVDPTRLRAVGRRRPVGPARGARGDRHALGGRAAEQELVLRNERLRPAHRPAGFAVEDVQPARFGRHADRAQLPVRGISGQVEQHRRRGHVVAPDVVRHELVIPAQCTRPHVERDERRGVQIVARPLGVVVAGRRVAGSEIDQAQFRVDRRGRIDRTPARLPRLAVACGVGPLGFQVAVEHVTERRPLDELPFPAPRRGRVPAPHQRAGRRVVRGQKRPQPAPRPLTAQYRDVVRFRLAQHAAVTGPAHADEHLAVVHRGRHVAGEARQRVHLDPAFRCCGVFRGQADERSQIRGVAGHRIDHRHVPHDRAAFGVQRQQPRVRGHHVQPAVAERRAAVVRAATQRVHPHLVRMTPAFAARRRVQRHHVVVRRSQIQHPVRNDRTGRKRADNPRLIYPFRHQPAGVLDTDSIQAAVPLVGVAVSVGQPVGMVFVRGEEPRVLDRAGRTASADKKDRQQQNPPREPGTDVHVLPVASFRHTPSNPHKHKEDSPYPIGRNRTRPRACEPSWRGLHGHHQLEPAPHRPAGGLTPLSRRPPFTLRPFDPSTPFDRLRDQARDTASSRHRRLTNQTRGPSRPQVR